MVELLLLIVPVAAQLLLISALSAYLNKAAYERFGRKAYLFFMFPGVVTHELAHLAACILTRTRVYKVKLFEPRMEGRTMVLGYVEHAVPSNAIFGTFIGAAPFFLGSVALWGIARLFDVADAASFAFAPHAAPRELIDSLAAYAGEYVRYFAALASALDWRSGWTYLFLYTVVGLAAHLSPSQSDMKNAYGGLFMLMAALAATLGIGHGSGYFSAGDVAAALSRPLEGLIAVLSYGLAGGILAIAVVHALAAPQALARKLGFRRRARRRDRR